MIKKNVFEFSNEEELDLASCIGIIRDRIWVIISITGISLFISLAYTIFATPVYQADALIQVTTDSQGIPGITDISQMLSGNTVAPHSATEIAIISSRSVMESTADELGLSVTVIPHYFPGVIGFLVRFLHLGNSPNKIFNHFISSSGHVWKRECVNIPLLEVPKNLFEIPLKLVSSGEKNFKIFGTNNQLIIQGKIGERVSNHGITVFVTELHGNPNMYWTLIKHSMLKVAGDLQRRIKANENSKGSGIITLTYQDKEPEMARVILAKICEVYLKQNIFRNSAEAAGSLEFVRSQLPVVHRQLEKAELALNAYQIRSHSIDISLQTKGLLDELITIDNNLSQLLLKKTEINQHFTQHHPIYQGLQQQIIDIKAKKDLLSNQINNLPNAQKELLRLNRDVQVSNQIYTGLLDQEQKLDIARAGNIGNVRLIDTAIVDPNAPISPKKANVIMIGILFGLFLSISYVFMRTMMNRGIESPELIEQLGLTVYSLIPISYIQSTPLNSRKKYRTADNNKPRGLLAVEAPTDLAIESLRSLRTSLHFALLEAKNNILMISGPSPGAGKTFVSSNLAAVVAQNGQHVLLIDGDLRKGILHKVMNDNSIQGLSDILKSNLKLTDVIRKSSINGLDYISRGCIPQNPSELLSHPKLGALLSEANDAYDLIIIDTPPILAVTDAGIIGSHAGTSLMVIQFAVNSVREIALAKNRFEQNSVQIKGAVLNAVQPRSNGYQNYGCYEYKFAED